MTPANVPMLLTQEERSRVACYQKDDDHRRLIIWFNERLHQERNAHEQLVEALTKLSTLGGGRSEGNCIAQEALKVLAYDR